MLHISSILSTITPYLSFTTAVLNSIILLNRFTQRKKQP